MSVSAAEVRATLLAREQAERARGRERADRVLARVPPIVRLLREAGARRVILFGSLATDSARPDSDLDLAVEGLAPTGYFALLAEATRLAGVPVDLVRLEEAGDSLRERIVAEGRDL